MHVYARAFSAQPGGAVAHTVLSSSNSRLAQAEGALWTGGGHRRMRHDRATSAAKGGRGFVGGRRGRTAAQAFWAFEGPRHVGGIAQGSRDFIGG